MQELTRLIKEDMRPALGVTEPGAIAFIMSMAKSKVKGEVTSAELYLNSGMYKNAFSCGIPNSTGVGNVFAAALGLTAGNPEKELEALAAVTPEDNEKAGEMIDRGIVKVYLDNISSRIYMKAVVKAGEECCEVTIRDSHTNICEIKYNGDVIFAKEVEQNLETEKVKAIIHNYSLKDILFYADNVPLEEIDFVKEAYDINLELFNEGLYSSKTTFAPYLFKRNGSKIYSADERLTAQLLCNTALEARVIGLGKPAMSITGSGAHGIICTMPLYAVYSIHGMSEERLYRATVLSYLVTQYIKHYSGRLSAFCGCAIAGGTGMACALAYLKGADYEKLKQVIQNMASGITGMICDGGNQGCTMKGITAVDAAFSAVELAMEDVFIADVHGINGASPEDTMRNMGLIASPGMIKTEEVIVKIMEERTARKGKSMI